MEKTKSNGVEYHVSSLSGGANCVAVAKLPTGDYVVRHSRNGEPHIVFTREEWKAFTEGVKNAEFDF